jgi:hypothetical protein
MGSGGCHARLVSALLDGGAALCGAWMREPQGRPGEDLGDCAAVVPAVLLLGGLVTRGPGGGGPQAHAHGAMGQPDDGTSGRPSTARCE